MPTGTVSQGAHINVITLTTGGSTFAYKATSYGTWSTTRSCTGGGSDDDGSVVLQYSTAAAPTTWADITTATVPICGSGTSSPVNFSGTAISNVLGGLNAGVYNFRAHHNVAGFGNDVDSASTSVTINKANTATSVAQTGGSTVYSANLQLTATVSALSSTATGPFDGFVQFKDGASNLGPQVAVSGTTAVLSINGAPFMSVGSRNITATYTPSTSLAVNFSSSASGGTETAQALTITPEPSQVAVSTNSPTAVGGSIQLTATVAKTQATAGTAIPTGSVQFFLDANPTALTGTASTPTPGVYILSIPSPNTSAWSAGTHAVNARFTGDANFDTSDTPASNAADANIDSQGSTTHSVAAGSTTFTNVFVNGTSAATAAYGTLTTFTAHVDQGAAAGAAQGTFHFTEGTVGGALICEGTLTAGGDASCSPVTALNAGNHTVVFRYDGDASHQPGAAGAVSATITQVQPKLVVTRVPDANTVYGNAESFHAVATFNGVPVGTVTQPTGTVTFKSNVGPAIVGGPVSVSSGADVSVTSSALLVGSHTVMGSFIGDSDGNYSNIDSTTAHGVSQATPTVTITSSSASSIVVGNEVTFTAIVNPPAGFPTGVGAPPLPQGVGGNAGNGTVAFKLGGSAITATSTSYDPVSKVYTFTTDTLPVSDTNQITATYNGDPNFFAATSSAFTQKVTISSLTKTTASSFKNTTAGGTTFTSASSSTLGVESRQRFGLKVENDPSAPVGLPAPLTTSTVTFHFSSTRSVPSDVVVNLGSTKPTSGAQAANSPADTTTAYVDTADNQLLPGSYTVTADWSGDANHTALNGISIGTFTVNKGTPTVTVSNPGNSIYGNDITVTGTVAAPTAGAITYPVPSNTIDITSSDGYTLANNTTLNGSGSQSVTVNRLPVLSGRTYTVHYDADINYLSGSNGTSGSSDVTKASTWPVMQASDVNPSNLNQPVTFTVAIRPCKGTDPVANCPAGTVGHGQPNGTVTIYDTDGTTVLGSSSSPIVTSADAPPVGVNSNDGSAFQITVSNLTAGKHFVTAKYVPGPNFSVDTALVTRGGAPAGSDPGVVTQIVNTEGVTVTLSSSKNPSIVGDVVTISIKAQAFLATGTPTSPTGTVTLKDGATDLGTLDLTAASGAVSNASKTLAADLSVGTHSLTATYNGDANHAGGSAGTLQQVVGKAPTAAVLTTSSTVFGQSATLSAKVTSAVAGAISGAVTFKEGSTTLGTGTVGVDGTATFSTSTLAVGSHSITASYEGDAKFLASEASGSQIVTAAASTTTLASSSNPAGTNSTVTITATVAAKAPGAGIPTGSVVFKEGVLTLGSGSLSAGGTATFQAVNLTEGTHNIIATYAGDTNFLGSEAAQLAQVISADALTITVASSPNPSDFGQQVTMTANLTGGKGPATGQVTFTTSSLASLGSATIDGTGKAVFTTGILPPGTQTITATFGGDAKYKAGTGSTSHVVNKAAATVAVTSSLNPSQTGASVTLSAVVTSAATGVTGEVEFLDGTVSLGKVQLVSASASVTTSALTVGAHSITAVYAGNNSFNTATSAPFTQQVNAPGTSSGGPDAGASSSSSSSSGSSGASSSSSSGGTSSGSAGVDAGAVTVGGDSSDDGGCNTSNGDNSTTGAAAFLLVAGAVIVSRRRRQPTARR